MDPQAVAQERARRDLERLRGVSFVRSALQQEPLRSSAWLTEWRESGDAGQDKSRKKSHQIQATFEW